MRLYDTQFAPTGRQLPLFKVFSIPELFLKYEASIITNASAPHHSSVPFGIINIQLLSLLDYMKNCPMKNRTFSFLSLIQWWYIHSSVWCTERKNKGLTALRFDKIIYCEPEQASHYNMIYGKTWADQPTKHSPQLTLSSWRNCKNEEWGNGWMVYVVYLTVCVFAIRGAYTSKPKALSEVLRIQYGLKQ